MTFCGSVSSISRYTMRTSDSGPMGKASFEETMDNFLRAGAYGQDETTNGVSASIICGKRAQFGTGLCELKIDVNKLPKHIQSEDLLRNEVKENFEQEEQKEEQKEEHKENLYNPYTDECCDFDNFRENTNIETLLDKNKFIDCKYKALGRFGVIQKEGDKIKLKYNYERAENVILNWKDGIKTKKQIFKGYNSIHNVYIHSEDGILKDGDIFMIIEEYTKVEKIKRVRKK